MPGPDFYHVPASSKLPVAMALVLGVLLFGLGSTLQDGGLAVAPFLLVAGLVGFFVVLTKWFTAVHDENSAHLHNDKVKASYTYGMVWFISSEVAFFAGFFGALLYVRVFAVPWLGGEGDKGLSNELWEGFQATWPLLANPNPAIIAPHADMSWPGFSGLASWLPLWNTILLLASSWTVTISHHHLKEGNTKGQNIWLGATIALAVVFLFVQAAEYVHAYAELGLTLDSGIYGSTFFLLTGFHGFHVTMGTIMLSVILFRSLKGHFTAKDHFGFEGVAWYWHFVDVVWVFLFVFVYCI